MIELPKRVREHALGLAPDRFPLCVYDLSLLDEHARYLRECLPSGIGLHIAAHDPVPGMATTLAAHVRAVEVVSGAGLRGVRRESPALPAALTGPGKTGAEIGAAVAEGGVAIHVDSPGELRLVASAADASGRATDVLLRTEPTVGDDPEASPGGSCRPGAGMDAASLVECAEILRGSALVRLRGFAVAPDRLPGRPGARGAAADAGADAAALAGLAGEALAALRPWSTMFGLAQPRYVIGGALAGRMERPGAHARFDWRHYGAVLERRVGAAETVRVTPMATPETCCGWFLTRVLDVKHHRGRAFAVVADAGRPIARTTSSPSPSPAPSRTRAPRRRRHLPFTA